MVRKGGHMPEETKAKISLTLKEYLSNPEVKAKRSESTRGVNNPNYGKPRSKETREKISKSHIGKFPSLETRAKMSASRQGENNPNYGKHLSTETKELLSKANKGKVRSPEVRAKISIGLTGRPCSPKTREKISESNKGKKLSFETRNKISESLREYMKDPFSRERISLAKTGVPQSAEICLKKSIAFSGAGNPSWKGGISFEPYCPKFNDDLKRRVRAYFDHQCILCGKSTEENGKLLSVHHVEYNKNACCDGKPVQFAALCSSCHSKTGSKRANWESMIHVIINEIYSGRSYFTKDEWKFLSQPSIK